jgi:hypothetical protein
MTEGGPPRFRYPYPALSLPLPRAFVTLTPRGGLVLIFILGFLDSRLRGNDGGRPPALSLPLPRAFVTLANAGV